MSYVCDELYTVVYVRVSRFDIHLCNCDLFSVVNVYLDHFKLCVVSINGRRYVCCSECNVSLMSVMHPHPAVCNLLTRTVVKVLVCLL